jgi:beta-mannosidase
MELSRVVPGEMMAQAFAEWRSCHSHNRGALIWFYKDLWPAAGWGIVDSSGMPKATWYFLKRMWQPRQITITNEGLNGLHLHVTNERTETLKGFVEVTLLKEPNTVVATNEVAIGIAGRDEHCLATSVRQDQTLASEDSRQWHTGRWLLKVDEVLGSFYDVSYAYRFGPPHHDLVIARLLGADRSVLSEAYHFIRRRESIVAGANVEASAQMTSESEYRVAVRTDRFLHNVRFEVKGFLPDDNYFHLAPGHTKVVRFAAIGRQQKAFRAGLEALNLESPVSISVPRN